MKKISKPDYLAKVKRLSRLEVERLLSRMGGKLPRRLQKDKLSQEEALAIQMELEDEQLASWRKMISLLRKKEAARKSKAKPAEKATPAEKAKPAKKTKPAEKSAAPAKARAVKKK